VAFYCEACGNEVIKSYPDGKWKLRTNIVIWEDGKAFCKCAKCHSDVPIPVTLELPTGRKLKYYVLEMEDKDDTSRPKLEKCGKETKVP